MRTVNAKVSVARTAAALAAALVLGSSNGASAQVAQSDYTAGYVVLPKVVVNVTGSMPAAEVGELATDTLVQMTNTNQADPINVDCWWVNANKHCGTDAGEICETIADCAPGLQCVQGWSETDFQIRLTPGQPIGFVASTGLGPNLPCDPSFPGPGCFMGETAAGLVKPVPENPFQGELKCVQVDDSDVPVVSNDLKIEATIVSTTAGGGGDVTTAASYNGVGFEALEEGTGGSSGPLCLGSLPAGADPEVECAATYAPCPGVLHLEHFFENAQTDFGTYVTTELTLVPCSEDLAEVANQANLSVTAQMLVYNEFEQRFSTNSRVSCYENTRLSDIDTQPGPAGDQYSIFNVGVQGTLVGQTRIRGVRGPDGPYGYGLLGVAMESHELDGPVATSATNVQHVGIRAEGDAVYKTQYPAPGGG